MLDLEAIKARLAAATPGPWEEEREGGGYPTGVVYGPDCTVTSCDSEPGTIHQCTNAIFIANAPSDIAALVAEVERLTRERDLQPTITAEDAARCAWNVCGDEPEDGDAAERIDAALHAHAVRAKVPRG